MFDFGAKVPQVSADDVMKSIENLDDFVLLDVRTPEEFGKSRIEKSINIPVDRIQDSVEKTILDKGKKVYAYCLSGSRSNMAVDEMIKLGYTNVFSITSGMLAWRAKKFPLLV